MAHIWHLPAGSDAWRHQLLPAGGAALMPHAGELITADLPPADGLPERAAAVCLPASPASDTLAGGARWILLSRTGVRLRVNGQPVPLGLRVLCDRDEIWLEGHRCFFSDEQLADVAPFPGSGDRAVCPRCQQPLEQGQPAVRCPSCRAWHHALESLPCWSYAPTCALCRQQQTADATAYNFNPDRL